MAGYNKGLRCNCISLRKSTFCQKVTVHKVKNPFISNLKKPACASKQDVLELATLRYLFQFFLFFFCVRLT